jgi:hypothetical protein
MLEPPGPFDIVLFIESRLQFNHGRDLFSLLCGVDQRLRDFGLLSGAVQTDLDRQHVRVVRGLPNKSGHRRIRHVGMMKQEVASLIRSNIEPRALICSGTKALRGRNFKSGRFKSHSNDRSEMFNGTVNLIHIIRFEPQRLAQVLNHLPWHCGRNFQSHRRSETPPP